MASSCRRRAGERQRRAAQPKVFAIVIILGVKNFTAVIERCTETGLLVGFVPGFPGAHSQAESLDELNENLREVIAMLLEDGVPTLESEFVGTQLVGAA